MNADRFRHLFSYHFMENRSIWDNYIIPLSREQFVADADYSHGSVRDQIVHLMSVDDTWFCGLRGEEIPAPLAPGHFADRQAIRARWDEIERRMGEYLAELEDELVGARPFPPGEDEALIVWQVLFQVLNHGTDHRAQILRLLNDLGVRTTSQDYIFFAYEQPVGGRPQPD